MSGAGGMPCTVPFLTSPSKDFRTAARSVSNEILSRGRDARNRSPRRPKRSGVPPPTFPGRWRCRRGRQGRPSLKNQDLDLFGCFETTIVQYCTAGLPSAQRRNPHCPRSFSNEKILSRDRDGRNRSPRRPERLRVTTGTLPNRWRCRRSRQGRPVPKNPISALCSNSLVKSYYK